MIAACFLSVGLLLIAAYGGGLTEVALALIDEAVLTAALVTMIARPRPRPLAEALGYGIGNTLVSSAVYLGSRAPRRRSAPMTPFAHATAAGRGKAGKGQCACIVTRYRDPIYRQRQRGA